MNQHDASREEPRSGCLESWARPGCSVTLLCDLGWTLLFGLGPGFLQGYQAFSKAGSVFWESRSQNYVTNLDTTLISFFYSFILNHIIDVDIYPLYNS